ncbi:MAG: rhomboid family intramembrane serine protease [Nitrospirae bacterium]|jgi:membrane associated rhomboid family serine protease|nr:rhomboid family intramembrane serine protease [Nitrospirota bacterium]
MIPYKDDNPTRIFPFITIFFIALNIFVFLLQITYPSGMKETAYTYGAIPRYILTFETNQPVHPAVTVFTSMFMHGGLFHLAGNMLYLWIFGNNIEDRLGHLRFIIFYFFCGVFAAYAHAITNADSTIPMIGASGAVSGILGAYLILFPRAGVYTIIFLGFLITTVKIPALIVIGFWAIIQLISGLISTRLHEAGGVAWFAHLGGFLIGLATIKLWLPRRTKLWL